MPMGLSLNAAAEIKLNAAMNGGLFITQTAARETKARSQCEKRFRSGRFFPPAEEAGR